MTKSDYIATLPDKPYCTDRLGKLLVRRASVAAEFPILQPNWPEKRVWMPFDVDHVDAWLKWEQSKLPDPTYIAINPSNGHAHMAWRLRFPVSLFNTDSDKPLKWYRAIERAFRRILDADSSYSGFTTKNPFHPNWIVDLRSNYQYSLEELNEVLTREDKRWEPRKTEVADGVGRNKTLFDLSREVSYRTVLKFKKDGKDQNQFLETMIQYGLTENRQFEHPLPYTEVACIGRSVTGWAWEKFTPERFSAIQAARARRRWGVTEATQKPWLTEGISRRTWYRRRSKASS